MAEFDWFFEHAVPNYACPACGDGKLAVAWPTIKVEDDGPPERWDGGRSGRYTGFFYCRSCCEAVASSGQAQLTMDPRRMEEINREFHCHGITGWDAFFKGEGEWIRNDLDLSRDRYVEAYRVMGMRVMGYKPEHFIANTATDVFVQLGDNWRVRFGGRTALLRDSKGMQYLRHLLARPGMALPAEQLEAGGAALVAGGVKQELVDEQTRRELQKRLREDIDAAEREQIEKYLAAATGLRGRARNAPEEREKARQRVAHALAAVRRSLAEHLPELHAHLEESLTMGGEPCYSPTPSRTWVTADDSPRT